jgi:hypothetical protein
VVASTTATHALSLLNDAGTAWMTGTIGAGPTLQNSPCTVQTLTAGASPSGNTWTVNVPVTFAAGYSGAKQLLLAAIGVSGQSSGWQDRGDWTARPRVDGVWPSSARVGEVIQIAGLSFGAAQGGSSLRLNGTAITPVQSWSDTLIQVEVPAGAATTGNPP